MFQIVVGEGIIVKRQGLEVIPVLRRIIAIHVMEDFAGSGGGVSLSFEVAGNGNKVGQVGLPPVLVIVDTGRRRKLTAHNRSPARAANRGGCVCVKEGGSSRGQTIHVGGMDLAGVPAHESYPVIKIVYSNEQHVGG